jgi:hypothetical protein
MPAVTRISAPRLASTVDATTEQIRTEGAPLGSEFT